MDVWIKSSQAKDLSTQGRIYGKIQEIWEDRVLESWALSKGVLSDLQVYSFISPGVTTQLCVCDKKEEQE